MSRAKLEDENKEGEDAMADKKRSNWTHCFPAWVAGPRSLHPKFGGGVIVGGIEEVEDRLVAIKKRFPDDLSSGHVFHEVGVAINDKAFAHSGYSSPNAISFSRLKDGIAKGKYPKWSAMTAPAFGLGIPDGMILNPDLQYVEMAEGAHRQAIIWSRELAQAGLGRGYNIWWPAFDSYLAFGPLSLIGYDEAVKRLEDFWAKLLGSPEPGATMCLEYKPSVPGRLDFMPTMKSAVAFCKRVNERIGRKAMTINLEWAHALIGGQTVAEATKLQVEAGMFSGLVHVNSADLAIVHWDHTGTLILKGTPGDDADWPVGFGSQERYDDQLEAVRILDGLGVDIVAEHDIDPAGINPFEYYQWSREILEIMLGVVRAE